MSIIAFLLWGIEFVASLASSRIVGASRWMGAPPQSSLTRMSIASVQLEIEGKAMGSSSGKEKENRLRQMAERRGFSLEKSRRRDREAPDFGRFRIIGAVENSVVFGAEPYAFSATLEDVEKWLGERPDGPHASVIANITRVIRDTHRIEREAAKLEGMTSKTAQPRRARTPPVVE